VNTEYWIVMILALGIAVYLVHALLRPEKY
jgi:K+-transporting ATPase KdpF subunit